LRDPSPADRNPELELSMLKQLIVAAGLIAASATALAETVLVFGNNSNSQIASFLNANGHSATNIGGTGPTAAQLAGVDTVVMTRTTGNAALAAWVQAGGLLITEWDASVWALGAGNLIAADDANQHNFIGTGTPITHTAAGLALGLGTGLPNPYSDTARTEFARSFVNLGAGVDVLATRGANVATIIGGASGAGYALINGLDWADGFIGAGQASGQWLLNALGVDDQGNAVPEPGVLGLLAAAGFLAFTLRRRRD
jgi:hypothetical protein